MDSIVLIQGSTLEKVNIQEDISVNFLIYETSNQYVTNHWHTHLEVIYLMEGNMDVTIENRNYHLLSGHFIIINSSAIHSTQCYDKTKVLLLQIPYTVLKKSIPDYDHIQFKIASQDTKLNSLLLMMAEVFTSRTEGYQLQFKSLLYSFLYELVIKYKTHISIAAKNKAGRNLERLEIIMDYVKEHYSETTSLEQVSSMINLNPEYFCRFFKRYMGITFLEYVNNVRLSHVYEDLITTDDTITHLTEKHGFTNYKSFSRMFQQTYSQKPMQARKSHRYRCEKGGLNIG